MIIGISGPAGSGKSTVAGMLEANHGFASVALADPMKRFCAEVFRFTYEQLWGPSEARNAEDTRFLHRRIGSLGTTIVDFDADGKAVLEPSPVRDQYLSPRKALQLLGTEWGRRCYESVWIDYGLRVAKQLLEKDIEFGGGCTYHPATGIERLMGGFSVNGVVFSDLRFIDELEAIRRAGGKLVRMKRGTSLESDYASHESEQLDIEDSYSDYVIDNRDTESVVFTLDDLVGEVGRMVKALC